jgi:hypothetical protein
MRLGSAEACPVVSYNARMPRPGLIDQQELLRWANTVSARSDFPRLIRRLILETGRGVVQLGFPAGEGVSAGSWDGTVRSTEATAFIPLGLSLWELSVEKSVGRKADADYNKRTATPDGSPTTECTYVAASIRRWRERQDWARTHAADGRWKTVRAYGVDDIETWLDTAPVTHAWISERLGHAPHGLVPADTWWEDWSQATTPVIPFELVLAGEEREPRLRQLSKPVWPNRLKSLPSRPSQRTTSLRLWLRSPARRGRRMVDIFCRGWHSLMMLRLGDPFVTTKRHLFYLPGPTRSGLR